MLSLSPWHPEIRTPARTKPRYFCPFGHFRREALPDPFHQGSGSCLGFPIAQIVGREYSESFVTSRASDPSSGSVCESVGYGRGRLSLNYSSGIMWVTSGLSFLLPNRDGILFSPRASTSLWVWDRPSTPWPSTPSFIFPKGPLTLCSM